jgi:hypothetical protein
MSDKRAVIPNEVRDLAITAGSSDEICVIAHVIARSFASLRMTRFLL